jgi:hypothetical protein
LVPKFLIVAHDAPAFLMPVLGKRGIRKWHT